MVLKKYEKYPVDINHNRRIVLLSINARKNIKLTLKTDPKRT